MRILLIFGTRPEAIKMCPLILALRKRPAFEVSVVVTGQHKELLSSVLDTFGIHPSHSLHLMREGQAPEQVIADTLRLLGPILKNEKPDLVLVHGDTASAFASALCCFYQKIPIGHVEAGLRTGDLNAPFPEEFHRLAVDLVSTVYFAPTVQARKHLLAEGKPDRAIFVTGNTGIDALKTTLKQDFTHPLLVHAPYLFLTTHRRENQGEAMRSIFRSARILLDRHPDHHLICPLHPSPTVQAIGREILSSHPRAHLTPPLSLVDCHNLLARADLVLTDSGGIQEECAALDKKTLVLRSITERPEGVASGSLIIVGTEEEAIVTAATRLLSSPQPPPSLQIRNGLYGTGNACEIIANILQSHSIH